MENKKIHFDRESSIYVIGAVFGMILTLVMMSPNHIPLRTPSLFLLFSFPAYRVYVKLKEARNVNA